MPTQAHRLVTAGQLARYLRVSSSTVRRWIEGRRLRAYRLGGARARYRVALADLKLFYMTEFGCAAIYRAKVRGL